MRRTKWSAEDRALGMHRRITRRDVLHGMAMAGGGALAGPLAGALFSTAALADEAAPASGLAAAPAAYPPALSGMRGSNDGSFENAHAARDGKVWDEVSDTGEAYDLVVVGAGISGLAAAHFYRAQTPPGARILLLDNHDDFGGHARRNEYLLDGRLHVLHGGTLEIDSPRPYSKAADGLLRALGLDVAAMERKYPGMDFFDAFVRERGMFFDRETFGTDKLIAGRDGKTWAHFLDESPLNPQARADVTRIEAGRVDYLAGKTVAQKKLLLSKISYRDYLRDIAKVDPQVLLVYDARTKGEWGVGIDAVSALDCWGIGARGFEGLKLDNKSIRRMGPTPAGYIDTGGSYRLHFPDGNATIARLLVRSLIPASAPRGNVEALVAARFDYGRLDSEGTAVRLRLRSTAVRARNLDAASGAPGVAVTYVRDGRAYGVRARHCVLACYNMIIPYLCPELPEAQKAALHGIVKTPLVYTTVALRSRRPVLAARVRIVEAPGCYHTSVYINPAPPIGVAESALGPDDPILLHMQRTPCQAGLSEHEQNRAGRRDLLATSFETFERKIREQLGRMFGPTGLDPARDITGITVNRWPHGYAPEYNSLFEPELPPEQQPNVIGRARLGRIAIANSDAGAYAYTDSAIDQAHRAVGELLHDA